MLITSWCVPIYCAGENIWQINVEAQAGGGMWTNAFSALIKARFALGWSRPWRRLQAAGAVYMYILCIKFKSAAILTITKKSYVCEALGLEEVAESRGQVAAETVPFQAKLLVLRIHSECEGKALPWPCAVTRPCVDSVCNKSEKIEH